MQVVIFIRKTPKFYLNAFKTYFVYSNVLIKIFLKKMNVIPY
jgi:hypothetical protein